MKTVVVYLLALTVFALGIWLIFGQGYKLNASSSSVSAPSSTAQIAGDVSGVEPSPSLLANLRQNLQDPLPRLFLQLIVILLAARLTGVNWIDSFALGALMNTRGLIELIALNIGYGPGILSPRIFAMLVIMALVTTCMTVPLLSFSDYLRARKLPVTSSI